jgi:hypothetical protein
MHSAHSGTHWHPHPVCTVYLAQLVWPAYPVYLARPVWPTYPVYLAPPL